MIIDIAQFVKTDYHPNKYNILTTEFKRVSKIIFMQVVKDSSSFGTTFWLQYGFK